MLVIARVFPPHVGGSGRFLWELYRRQPADEVMFAVGESAESEPFDSTCACAISRIPLDLRDWGLLPAGFWAYSKLYLELRRLARRHRSQAIHAATLLPEGWLAWMLSRSLGVPYLCFIHGEELAIVAKSRQLSWMARRVMRGASRIIANSQNTRDEILQQWPTPPERITVITPGVDVERFRPVPRDDEIRRRLGWHGKRVILTVSRLQPRKGHDNLIRALPRILKSAPDVLYAIVGDGECRSALERQAKDIDVAHCVHFYGELTEQQLLECYQQCDLFALPNRTIDGDFEGFGMVLVEAQACGRPVLAGRSGGTAETLRDGITGVLVHCDRPDDIANAVLELLDRPQKLEEMGAAARDWAVDKFDWRVLADDARCAFEQILGAPSNRLQPSRLINDAAHTSR